ncbi:MAG: DbpA RNA binding domain-containing protein, partial [Gammaproteobacteria bacterium]
SLDSKLIGRVDIRDDYSLVDLPANLPPAALQHLQSVWVVGQQLRIVPDGQPFEPPRKPGKLALGSEQPAARKPRPFKARPFKEGQGPKAFKAGKRKPKK